MGDSQAFAELTDPDRREQQVHCYRILGPVQDAEDVLQEVLLAAWQSLAGFEGRSSFNALRSASRRPRMDAPIFDLPLPEPSWTVSSRC